MSESEPVVVDRTKMRRFVEFPATLLVIGLAFVIIAAIAASEVGQMISTGPYDPRIVIVAVLASLCFVIAHGAVVRGVERAPWADFAVQGAVRELAAGIAVGAALFALVVGIAAAMGLYSIDGTNPWQTIWPILGMAAIVPGVSEEIIFRGIIFRYAERMTGSWIALAISAGLFGAAHLGNPNATALSAFAIAIEAGLLLGAVYMLTRRLWAAIGLHAAWNFVQGWVFGVPVSGIDQLGRVNGRLTGPDWLTGGAFGLEASAIAMGVATAGGLAVLALAIRRGRVVAPMWVRGTAAAPYFGPWRRAQPAALT